MSEEKTVQVHVGIGVSGCSNSWDTGCTHEEWGEMTEVEKDEAINDCLGNIIDVWTDYKG